MDSDILSDALLNFISSADFRKCLDSFLSENCSYFVFSSDDTSNHSHQHYELWKQFQLVVEVVIDSALESVGGSIEDLERDLVLVHEREPRGPKDVVIQQVIERLLCYHSFQDFIHMMETFAAEEHEKQGLEAEIKPPLFIEKRRSRDREMKGNDSSDSENENSDSLVDMLVSMGFPLDLVYMVIEESREGQSAQRNRSPQNSDMQAFIDRLVDLQQDSSSASQGATNADDYNASPYAHLAFLHKYMPAAFNGGGMSEGELIARVDLAYSVVQTLHEEGIGALSPSMTAALRWAVEVVDWDAAVHELFSQLSLSQRQQITTDEETTEVLRALLERLDELESLRCLSEESAAAGALLGAEELRRRARVEESARVNSQAEQLLHALLSRYHQLQALLEEQYRRIRLMTSLSLSGGRGGWGVRRDQLEELYLYLKEQLASGDNRNRNLDTVAEEMHSKLSRLLVLQTPLEIAPELTVDGSYRRLSSSSGHNTINRSKSESSSSRHGVIVRRRTDVVTVLLDIHLMEDEMLELKRQIQSMITMGTAREPTDRDTPSLDGGGVDSLGNEGGIFLDDDNDLLRGIFLWGFEEKEGSDDDTNINGDCKYDEEGGRVGAKAAGRAAETSLVMTGADDAAAEASSLLSREKSLLAHSLSRQISERLDAMEAALTDVRGRGVGCEVVGTGGVREEEEEVSELARVLAEERTRCYEIRAACLRGAATAVMKEQQGDCNQITGDVIRELISRYEGDHRRLVTELQADRDRRHRNLGRKLEVRANLSASRWRTEKELSSRADPEIDWDRNCAAHVRSSEEAHLQDSVAAILSAAAITSNCDGNMYASVAAAADSSERYGDILSDIDRAIVLGRGLCADMRLHVVSYIEQQLSHNESSESVQQLAAAASTLPVTLVNEALSAYLLSAPSTGHSSNTRRRRRKRSLLGSEDELRRHMLAYFSTPNTSSAAMSYDHDARVVGWESALRGHVLSAIATDLAGAVQSSSLVTLLSGTASKSVSPARRASGELMSAHKTRIRSDHEEKAGDLAAALCERMTAHKRRREGRLRERHSRVGRHEELGEDGKTSESEEEEQRMQLLEEGYVHLTGLAQSCSATDLDSLDIDALLAALEECMRGHPYPHSVAAFLRGRAEEEAQSRLAHIRGEHSEQGDRLAEQLTSRMLDTRRKLQDRLAAKKASTSTKTTTDTRMSLASEREGTSDDASERLEEAFTQMSRLVHLSTDKELSELDMDALCRVLEQYMYGEISSVPRRLQEVYVHTKDVLLREEARRITSQHEQEQEKLALVMRVEEARQRQAVQRKLLLRQGQQVKRQVMYSRDAESLIEDRSTSGGGGGGAVMMREGQRKSSVSSKVSSSTLNRGNSAGVIASNNRNRK